MKGIIGSAALSVVLMCGTASAQQINVKIGVLTDMSSLYADDTGPGSVAAARLAAEDFMKSNPKVKVEVISADHQNKADVGTNIANQWIDVEHVDMIADVPNSGVALAINEVTRRTYSDLQQYIEKATESLVETLRASDTRTRPFRYAQAQAAIRFCEVIFGPDYASLMKKAVEVAKSERKTSRKT